MAGFRCGKFGNVTDDQASVARALPDDEAAFNRCRGSDSPPASGHFAPRGGPRPHRMRRAGMEVERGLGARSLPGVSDTLTHHRREVRHG